MDMLIAQTRHFKGDPNASVTMIEFSDFQCPFCGRFATGVGRQIHEAYVQTGKVRFGYQHFAILGAESEWAAEASECAAEQEAFWAYHDRLFDRQAGENRGAFNKDNLKQFAADLGLDTAAFNTCLDSGKYTSMVRAESAAVQSLGVRGTPTFVVNGRPLVGAQPFEVFQQVIEAAIGESSAGPSTEPAPRDSRGSGQATPSSASGAATTPADSPPSSPP
jgi:protein-disulfide isomerase